MSSLCCEHCKNSSEDHDLLIKIEAHIAQQAIDMTRLANEGDEVHKDHETRIRSLEKYGSYAFGIFGFINFLLVAGTLYALLRK